jgi:hypothetical protein
LDTFSLCCEEITTVSTRTGRLEKINLAGFANIGEALREAVGELDGHGHQFCGFIAGETEHQALIPRATGIDAHGDVRRLALNGAHDGASFGIVAVFRAVVADAADGVADQLVVFDVRGGGDFASDNGEARGDQGFAGDAPLGVLLEDFIENRIGNLVGNLVGVAFGDGLRGEKKVA